MGHTQRAHHIRPSKCHSLGWRLRWMDRGAKGRGSSHPGVRVEPGNSNGSRPQPGLFPLNWSIRHTRAGKNRSSSCHIARVVQSQRTGVPYLRGRLGFDLAARGAFFVQCWLPLTPRWLPHSALSASPVRILGTGRLPRHTAGIPSPHDLYGHSARILAAMLV